MCGPTDCHEGMEAPPPRRDGYGVISTVLAMIGAVLAAVFVTSPVGWLIYAGSAITGIIHFTRRRDRAMLVQFTFYLIMNIVAVVVRVA